LEEKRREFIKKCLENLKDWDLLNESIKNNLRKQANNSLPEDFDEILKQARD
jgi:hypothetical protein